MTGNTYWRLVSGWVGPNPSSSSTDVQVSIQTHRLVGTSRKFRSGTKAGPLVEGRNARRSLAGCVVILLATLKMKY